MPQAETRRGRRNNGPAAPLVRAPKMLPRILDPATVNQLIAALRTARDRAMVEDIAGIVAASSDPRGTDRPSGCCPGNSTWPSRHVRAVGTNGNNG
jgi:hypothetical protein